MMKFSFNIIEVLQHRRPKIFDGNNVFYKIWRSTIVFKEVVDSNIVLHL